MSIFNQIQLKEITQFLGDFSFANFRITCKYICNYTLREYQLRHFYRKYYIRDFSRVGSFTSEPIEIGGNPLDFITGNNLYDDYMKKIKK